MTLMVIDHINQNDEQEQQKQQHHLVENAEMTGKRDWLTILETLPWSCDEDFSLDDLDGTLEPRPLQDMVQYPFRIKEFFVEARRPFKE